MARILVVEDEAEIRDDIADVLRYGGHQTVEAGNGRDALKTLLADPPDIVISDINMPIMDGRQFLETLRREHPEHDGIPFLFLSAFADRNDVIAGKKLGADDYLTKPVDHELLLETVNTRLRQVVRLDKKKQEELDSLRQSILHVLPHELRTPLNGILGFAELVKMELGALNASPDIVEYNDGIIESARRLNGLIENVLDLVAITSGTKFPQVRELHLGPLLESCVEARRRKADESGVTLSLDVPASLSPVRSDEVFLRKAVIELLTNGIKFTETGGRVAITARDREDGAVVITVSDTGRGIDQAKLTKLGAAFQSGGDWESHGNGGLGIGLSLARAFVETLGGHVQLTSQVRIGTQADIILPPSTRVIRTV
jgi:signal transduction histidine kinase